SCIWLLIATFFRLPVSGTHSIVGATVGFSLVRFGVKAINWIGLAKIDTSHGKKALAASIHHTPGPHRTSTRAVCFLPDYIRLNLASWFISPALSGLVSVGIFSILHYLVLIKDEPLEPALRLLPGFYGTVIAINVISVLLAGATAGDDAGPGLGDKMYAALKCHRVEMLCQRLRRDRKAKKTLDKEENGSQRKPTEISIVVEEASPDLNSSRNGRNGKTGVDDRHESATSVSGRQNSFRLVPTKFEVTSTKPAEPPAEPVHYLAVRAYPTEHDLSVTRRGMLTQPVLPPIGEEEPQELEIISDRPHEYKVFSQLQILTAVFDSFAHGGNDVR
ncbi:hypothetical protein T265_13577, partial [Opisthorchis viverrini]